MSPATAPPTDEVARLHARVQELLDANNREVERRRRAEKAEADTGVTFALQQLAKVLGLSIEDFPWDAATETYDGDVRAVIKNALTAAFGDGWQDGRSHIEGLIRRAEDAEAEGQRLAKLVYVPGLWCCPKCKFQLLQANLNADTGTVTAQDKPGEPCPNCHGPLWRVTERDAGNDMVRRCEEQVARAIEAETHAEAVTAQVVRTREALTPFAQAAQRVAHYGDPRRSARLFASHNGGQHLYELLIKNETAPLLVAHLFDALDAHAGVGEEDGMP